MPHYSMLYKTIVDVPEADYDREVAFWAGAIGRALEQNPRHPEYHGVMLPGEHFGLVVQHLEEGPARVHLDIHTDDLEAEVARLERLGARRVRMAHDWWIMQDPAGLAFCVIPEPQGTLSDENAQRWD